MSDRKFNQTQQTRPLSTNGVRTVAVQDLAGAALDWAVSKCRGKLITFDNYGPSGQWEMYSTNAAQSMPIIEENGIALRRHSRGTWYAMRSAELGDSEGSRWSDVTFRGVAANRPPRRVRYEGGTAAIAALRCYVASEMGEEIEVPVDVLEYGREEGAVV